MVQGSGFEVQSATSTRDDKRQPRFRELQFGCVRSGSQNRRSAGRRLRVVQSSFDHPQQVTGFDLGVAAPLGKTADAFARGSALSRSNRPERLEPLVVDRFERERDLKPGFRSRVELRGGPKRFLPIEVCAVALEADGQTALAEAAQPFAARRAERLRTPALKLAPLESNPFIVIGLRDLRRFVLHTSQFMRGG